MIPLLISGTLIEDVDKKLEGDIPTGQELIDCMTSLRFAAPELDSSLHAQLVTLFPPVVMALSSSFAVVR